MSGASTNVLSKAPISTLLNRRAVIKEWRSALNQITGGRFGGDRKALRDALQSTGLTDIKQHPKWWAREGVEDPALSLTANAIVQQAQSRAGLGLSRDDAEEFAARWAFSRLKSPVRDWTRPLSVSRFQRLNTLISGHPLPMVKDPTAQLIARVGHQLQYGWAKFHNIAIAEHLFECWLNSHDKWLFLLHSGKPDYMSYSADVRSINKYGDAIERAHAGLINDRGIECLYDLANIKTHRWSLAAQSMYQDKALFDAVNDVFFASAYIALTDGENGGTYLVKEASENLESAVQKLKKDEEKVGEALPLILNHADNIAHELRVDIMRRMDDRTKEVQDLNKALDALGKIDI